MISADSPFSVLTAVVAPALLTNSSTVLVLGLGNRIARVVDRTRTVAGVMARTEEDGELYQRLQQQAGLLGRRRQYLGRALRPVSYTHLDVYKRQSSTWSAPRSPPPARS